MTEKLHLLASSMQKAVGLDPSNEGLKVMLRDVLRMSHVMTGMPWDEDEFLALLRVLGAPAASSPRGRHLSLVP